MEKSYQIEHYFPRNFLLPCDKRLTLYNPRPSLPTFSLVFITPFNFKCQERKLFVVFLQFLVMRSSTRFLALILYQYPEVTYSDL